MTLDSDDGDKPADWVLFTPDFDYAKEPYDVRTSEGGEVVRCYPNAGMLHAMDGSDRYFYACQCEVRFVGWERFHADYVPPPERKVSRIELQRAHKEHRQQARRLRGLKPGEWRLR